MRITITFSDSNGISKKRFSAPEGISFWNILRDKIYTYAEKMNMEIKHINFAGKMVNWK
jgi:hypothetical protein